MRCLVIATEPDLRTAVVDAVETRGWRADVFEGFSPAMEAHAPDLYDVVVLGAGGDEVGPAQVLAFRESDHADVEILVIVPPEHPRTARDLLSVGASDFLVAPVQPEVLMARLDVIETQIAARRRTHWHGVPLATIVESAADAVEITDPDIVIRYVNPAFERIMGYSREEAIGATPASLFASGMHPPEFFAEMERIMAAGRPWTGTMISRRKDGSLIHLDCTFANVFNDRGQFTHRVAIKRDISERLRQEQALRASEERYALATRAANEGIWDWDSSRGRVFFSGRWRALFGLDQPGELRTLDDWMDRVHPKDVDRVRQAIAAQLAGEIEGLDTEHRVRHADGSWRWMSARAVAQKDDRGQVSRVVGSMTDVTALKRAQLELELARDRAVDANRAKSRFLANMSHELRTPLNAIIGYAEMLGEDAQDAGLDHMRQDLGRIGGAASHLLALINDVLDISKIEAGRMDLYVELFSVGDVVESVLTTIRGQIEQAGNVFECDLPNADIEVEADITKVKQILLNLLSNANKFTERGRVHLRVWREESEVCFAVTDTGIGISERKLATLFQPFVQGDASTTRRYGGSGLGLAISRHFCTMMGGDLTATSRVGDGSTFVARIPLHVEVLARDPSSENIESVQAVAGSGPNSVLVVDDDPFVHELVGRALADTDFEVRSARGGAEALRMVAEHRPDAIVLDVVMPDMDGWSVLSALKGDLATARIPVVLHTVMDERDRGLTLGAADYLLKPVDRDRLLQSLSRYRRTTNTRPVLVVDDEPSVRERLTRLLTSDGWVVETAVDGRSGLAALEAREYQVVLLDLVMPGMDGFELLAAIRDRPRLRGVPVVVLTSKDLAAEERAFLSGAVARVLAKSSYESGELLAAVRAALRQGQDRA